MTMLRRLIPLATGAWMALCCCAPEQSFADVTLTFEGLHDLEPILNYYDGGYGGNQSAAQMLAAMSALHIPWLSGYESNLPSSSTAPAGPGPNYGITFSSNALAVISAAAGGVGNFSPNPSGDPVAMYVAGKDSSGNSGVTMDVGQGFQGTLQFWFSGGSTNGAIASVYSGTDRSGLLLASAPLPSVNGSPQSWTEFSLPFTGTAYSVYINSPDGINNVRLAGLSGLALSHSSSVPSTPEASSFLMWSAMVLSGLGCVARSRSRRPRVARVTAR